VWLGVKERGDNSKLWLQEVGITESEGEPRVPPLKNEVWLEAANTVFSNATNAVLMTDSASAYKNVNQAGVVQKFSVNHSEHEYSRSVEVMEDVVTKAAVPGMAGTQLLDHDWRLMKAELPVTGLTARTPDGRARLANYIRAAQWKLMVSNTDRWPIFCLAVQRFLARERASQQPEPVADQMPPAPVPEEILPAPAAVAIPIPVQMEASPNEPADVHARRQQMFQAGGIWPTTPQQRLKQRSSRAGSSYACPPAFAEALKFGYVGPNLPDPPGYKWKSRDSGLSWGLAPQGG
jgi:hypothetical protein